VAVLLGLALGLLLLEAVPAGAVPRPGPLPTLPQVRSNTDLFWNGGLGPGQNVSGFIPDTNTPQDPHAPYPSGNPTSGYTSATEFAGIIHGQVEGGTAVFGLYCIDIKTNTYPGMGYGLGSWDAANVPNRGFVARILNEYYPNTAEPAALSDLNQKAAAVQAAIWYFSDGFVVNTSNSVLHDTVAAIVGNIQAKGPLVEPSPPTLAITPPHVSGPAGSVLGPFKVTTSNQLRRRPLRLRRRLRSAPNATVTITGGEMFSDAGGTTPIANGASVPSGQEIWVRATGGSTTAVLQATAEAIVPSGNVYLYDGKTAGYAAAQKLILAQTAILTTTVQATAQFLPAGSLVVRKTIAGPAAGSEGQVVIQVGCDDGVTRQPFVIGANTPAGPKSRTNDDIPAGTKCTVNETANGSVVGTDVVVTGDGQQVTIPSGKSTTVGVTDTYHHVGSLLVRKTIAGPAAGQEGEVTIHSVCNGRALTPDFVIGAHTPVGDYTKQYNHITVPATCTVTETADGHSSTVSVDTEGSGQKVSIPTGEIAEANITDAYGLVPGQLEVTKTITGPLAGQQGPVAIHTVCTPAANTPDFTISGGATGVRSQIYSGIPAGASCVVTETASGQTNGVTVAVSGSPHTATIPANGAAVASITDSYGAAPGSLLVTKTIAGPRAGHQGRVVIHVACNGTVLSSAFVIPAGHRAGSVSHSFDGIPAGSMCTVAETADGATRTVAATLAGNGQRVTVPAGKVVPVNLMDVYRGTPGSVRVIKAIAGRAARQHGRIAILVACGGPLHTFVFLIPARRGTGSVSRWFTGLPAGARCIVTEVAIGRTNKVVAVAVGRRHKVTIRANGRAIIHITDTFRRIIKVPIPRVTG
jgi:TQXA domain-containing protein